MISKSCILLSLIVLLFFSSCKTSKLVSSSSKESVKDSTFYVKDTIKIKVPGGRIVFEGKLITVPGKIYLKKYDTTIFCPPVKIQPQTIKMSGNNGLSGFIKIDSLGNLMGECNQKERELTEVINNKTRIITIQKQLIEKYKAENSRFGNIIHGIKNVGIVLIIILMAVGLTLHRFKIL